MQPTTRRRILTVCATLALTGTLAHAAPKKPPPSQASDRTLVAGICNAYGVHAAETTKARNEGMPLANALAVTEGYGRMLDFPALLRAELQELTWYIYAHPALTPEAARDGALLACTRVWLPTVKEEGRR